MCGVSAAVSFSNALSTSSRNGVPESDSSERSAEIQRAELRQRQAGAQALERLAVDDPPRAPVVARPVVVEGEARLFERLQIAADRPGRDAAQGSQIVDADAGRARALDLAQDRPLADDFRVPGHVPSKSIIVFG